MDVDPCTALGHPSLMLWMENSSNPTLSASIQELHKDFSPHPVSVTDGSPSKLDIRHLLYDSNGDGDDVLSLDTFGGAMARDGADTKQENIKISY